MSKELAIPRASELTRIAEARWAAAKADAVIDVARRAQLSDEDILPLLRQRGDVWRRWGILLGEPEPKTESGRKGGQAVSNGHGLENEERQRRKKARRIAAVSEPLYREWQAAEEPEALTFTRLLNGMGVHYSSDTPEWETPDELFTALNDEFSFTLDVCATSDNAKCSRYFTPEDDGLEQNWSSETCWMNPPYGRQIALWVEKAHNSATSDAPVVCLVPARTDTDWWWRWCRYGEIRFLKGRLRFNESETGAPFPSAVVVFGRRSTVKWWER
jgi:phage N-6-adenine-methyltransferase